MRLIGLIFATVAISLIVSSSSAMESNLTNLEVENNDFSRFYIERSSYETKLTTHIPAPQKYQNSVPPLGVKEIKYNSGNLMLKAWLSDKPADDNIHPAVVFAHGGFAFGRSGWDLAQEFLNQGFVLMMPMLRGENGNPGNFEFFYGEVDDLIAASDYLANVSYVDNNRIFLCGHSTGGTLSMLASMMPSKYRAIASFGGSPDQKIFFFDTVWGQYAPFDLSNTLEVELRSPIIYVDSILKPLFIYVGDNDFFYLESSRYFVDEAKNAGKPCKLIVVKGDHISSVDESIELSINEFKNIQSYEAAELNRSYAYEWFKKGFENYSEGRYEEAIDCYNKAIEIDPQYAEAFRDKGAALGELGLYEEAIEAFNGALEIDPKSAESWRNNGVALLKMGIHEEAIKCFDKAIEIDPQYAEAWYDKGNVLMDMGKYSEASFSYGKATELNPQHAESWYGKGLAYYNLGRYNEAINCYNKATSINPFDAMAWNNKGSALGSIGRYNEAVECFDKAIEIDDKLAIAWDNKGIALELLGKKIEADAAFAKARELEDKS